MTRIVKTFRDGDFAAGRKSSQNSIHSGLSTHESGRPALAVSRASRFSNTAWRSVVQNEPSGVFDRSAGVGALSVSEGCKILGRHVMTGLWPGDSKGTE